MAKLSESLSRYTAVLKANFDAAKAAVTDSDVKGALNENIVAEFLRDTVHNWFVSTNSQIIDSDDQSSDELDVCVCNDHQFFVQPAGGVLISEGVDFVVQVKAKLTDKELSRTIKNCMSVKRLKRLNRKGNTVYSTGILPIEWINFIPYFCFAFSSQLKPETLAKKLNDKSKNIDVTQQIDALFVLDRGVTLINGKDGRGHRWRHDDGNLRVGWHALQTDDATLLEFVRYCVDHVPRINHLHPPIAAYFPRQMVYPACGQPKAKDNKQMNRSQK